MKASPTENVVEVITRAIVEQRLVPRTKLNEQELADILGVSRTVVRQALIYLARDKLVSLEHNRGASVAEPSDLEMREIFETLTLLECAALEKISEAITSSDMAQLRQLAGEQRDAHDKGEQALEHKIGTEFHARLMRLSRNRVVQNFHAGLLAQERLFTSYLYESFDHSHLCSDHEELLDLLSRGELDRCRTLLAGHYRSIEANCLGRKARKPQMPIREALLGVFTNAVGSEGECQANDRSGEMRGRLVK